MTGCAPTNFPGKGMGPSSCCGSRLLVEGPSGQRLAAGNVLELFIENLASFAFDLFVLLFGLENLLFAFQLVVHVSSSSFPFRTCGLFRVCSVVST